MTATLLEPGLYPDLSEAAYFADPSLSQSGMKLLLEPSCPAIFRHQQLHPESRPTKTAWDVGSAVHKLVLGKGSDIVEVGYATYNTKAAQLVRDEAYAAGKIPLRAGEVEQVYAMAAAVRRHPVAAQLLGAGQPEVSLFWEDERTGVPLRARIDWLTTDLSGHTIAVDFKTAASAHWLAFQKSVMNYGYHMQDANYVDGIQSLMLDSDPQFQFIVQEKIQPYLVQVFELIPDVVAAGRALNRKAIDLYQRCLATDEWPGYSDSIESISLPPWYSTPAPEEAADDIFGEPF